MISLVFFICRLFCFVFTNDIGDYFGAGAKTCLYEGNRIYFGAIMLAFASDEYRFKCFLDESDVQGTSLVTRHKKRTVKVQFFGAGDQT